MINDSKIIENIIEEIDKIPSECLKEAVDIIDEKFNTSNLKIKVSYAIVNEYKLPEELYNFNELHRKRYFGFLSKNNKKILEAA